MSKAAHIAQPGHTNMPTIYIDDKPYEVPTGNNLLQACLSAGIDLPYFCWHPEMGSVGACRQCAVVQFRDEEDTRGRIVMGCMTPVAEGARFSLSGDTASQFRKTVVEALMLNHPHDCPVCAEGGECHLQDMTVMTGHRDRRYRGKKNTHRNQYLGPLVNHEMNRCIACYRCERFYNDYAGGRDFAAQGAHDHVYFGRQRDGVLESEFAGNLVEVCPTGVFTDKPLANDYTRKWDMQSAPSVCTGCAVGCNTMPGERYGELKRVHNRFNNEVNGYFLCDRGRYGGSFVNDEKRAQFAGLRQDDGRYNAIAHDEALSTLSDWCGSDQKIVGIGSPRASLESNYLLREVVGPQNFCCGTSDGEAGLNTQIADILSNGSVVTPSIRQVESADAVLVLGEDITNTAARLALALRQSVRNLPKQLASELRIPEWQDEAVRVLAQDKLSPLYIAAISATRLDDIAEQTIHMHPDDIARFGHAIAAELDSSLEKVGDLDESTSELVKQVATSLKNAKRPLIVSGVSCQSAAVIEAASSVAHALDNSIAMLSFCMSECNSMGSALMADEQHIDLQNICQRARDGAIDTLLVLENDLYRRAARADIDSLLSNVNHLVVLDSIDSPTYSRSSLALPAASSFESEGTLLSSEGRAQRHYPVYLAAEQRSPSWCYLRQLGQILSLDGFAEYAHFDDVTTACSESFSMLSAIKEASPSGDYRDRGVKIPRQTHRYSGRTAMRANISVHEPKQPQDDDTPFSYSMEGSNGKQPGALIPFTWAPGWNSNQSIHKFQSEVGGALKGGTPGVRIIEPGSSARQNSVELTNAYTTQSGKWQLLPNYHLFGSEELSSRSPAIMELIGTPGIVLSGEDANLLAANQGDTIIAEIDGHDIALELCISENIAAGCANYSIGVPDAVWIAPGSSAKLRKASTANNGGGDV